METKAEKFPKVEPVDLNEVSLTDFTDRDIDVPTGNSPKFPLPYYLAHFHRLANTVVEEGEHRGYRNRRPSRAVARASSRP